MPDVAIFFACIHAAPLQNGAPGAPTCRSVQWPGSLEMVDHRMLSKLRPWGLIAVVCAALAVANAFSAGGSSPTLGQRSTTLVLAGIGIASAVIGLIALLRRPYGPDWLFVVPGGIASAAVLGVAWFLPGLLTPVWLPESAEPDGPKHVLMLVPLAGQRTYGGEPPDANTWADYKTHGYRQDDLFIWIEDPEVGTVVEKPNNSYFTVRMRVNEIRHGRGNEFSGFHGKDKPKLFDESGRTYELRLHRPRNTLRGYLAGGLVVDELLCFDMPTASAKALKLEIPTSGWQREGIVRFSIPSFDRSGQAAKMTAEIIKLKRLLKNEPEQSPDLARGRMIFARNCQECHTLFGTGNKVGPELTAHPKRNDIDFLITNVVNPSAEIAKGYEPKIVITTAGVVHNGIIKETKDPSTIVLQLGPKSIAIPKEEIEDIQASKVSIMPTDILKDMEPHDIQCLFAYIMNPRQTPILSTLGSTNNFFNAQTFIYWQSAGPPWTIDQRELTAPAASRDNPSILTSEFLLADDMDLQFQMKLGPEDQLTIGFRGDERFDGPIGPSVEVRGDGTATWIGDGREPQTGKGAIDTAVWNKVEFSVLANRAVLRLNGAEVLSIAEPKVPPRRLTVFRTPSPSVRLRNLYLALTPSAIK